MQTIKYYLFKKLYELGEKADAGDFSARLPFEVYYDIINAAGLMEECNNFSEVDTSKEDRFEQDNDDRQEFLDVFAHIFGMAFGLKMRSDSVSRAQYAILCGIINTYNMQQQFFAFCEVKDIRFA